MTSVYRHATERYQAPRMKPMRCIHTRWRDAYACRDVSRTNVRSTCAGRACALQQSLEIQSNKISFRTLSRGAELYSPFDRIRLIATNGRSVTHLPFALPRVHGRPGHTIRFPKGPVRPFPKRCPGNAPYGASTNIRTRKRERVGIPCLEKRSRRPSPPVARSTSDTAIHFVRQSFNRITSRQDRTPRSNGIKPAHDHSF